TTFLDAVGPARRRAVGQITGIGYRYPAPRGAHRLTGTRVPDVALKGGRLYEALRGGRFVLITPEAYEDQGARKDRLAVEHWASDRRTALLVRPDGYVAWAADSADAQAIEEELAAHVG
ncbi:MAG: FAD-dependent oxidoreductase, partial [Streptomyces sp.]|nr:FAD-dependent oxidoreductase [Streptomyces sp.]